MYELYFFFLVFKFYFVLLASSSGIIYKLRKEINLNFLIYKIIPISSLQNWQFSTETLAFLKQKTEKSQKNAKNEIEREQNDNLKIFCQKNNHDK